VLVAVISRQADGYYIAQDQGEAAGQLNGEQLTSTSRPPRDGDAVEMTGTRMRFAPRFRFFRLENDRYRQKADNYCHHERQKWRISPLFT
jgi:hypothetical protein